MKQQKYYNFLQRQILVTMGLSLIPGLVYVIFGWVFNVLYPALLWYGILILISLYGWKLYKDFAAHKMDDAQLKRWYTKLTWFMYLIFFLWSVIFILYVDHHENNLNYIAIFTQLGAAVVASALLISDKKLFVPILFSLMLPLILYFMFIGVWYGYVLSLFSLIFLGVLLYASFNTNKLLQENYFQAQHDALTGIYNRRYFTEYMEALNERLLESRKRASICLIDLDHFKTINDSLGHDIGDKLLIEVTKRIQDYLEEGYILARVGGDEFVLVSRAFADEEFGLNAVYDFAESLLTVVREPYSIEEHHLHISASIGIHEINPSSLYSTNFIKEMDIAMYEAKSQGRDGVVIFDEALAKSVERHLKIEQKLHEALREKKIKIYYQPQFDIDESLVGCESLIRWHDEELGEVAPDEFIPVAENTGLILEIGHYVLKETFQTITRWNEHGEKLKSFSINISMRQLLYASFIEEVEALLQRYFPLREDKQKIYFEITEHLFAEDITKVVSIMNRLKALGISFSIDDFGTGYSSLRDLKVLPIDEVKIDHSFIHDLSDHTNNQKMVSALTSIAKSFNLNIVAEGVETFNQIAFLNGIHCDVYQGFYFEEALSPSLFEEKYMLSSGHF
ncbi:MAG: EAL domain-containing protein [Campylobacterota bacterium]|nr:EAL domain-containing protein [Campylobacterota bacterium]